jgi:cell division protein FtsI/penicillin-binding protein 2
MRRVAVFITAVILGASALTACTSSGEDDKAGPDDAAAALANGLASGDFADVEFTVLTAGQVTADYKQAVEGMGEAKPTVGVADVEDSDGAATARLAWSWPLAGEKWTYTSKAQLTDTDDGWEVVWRRDLVEPSLDKRTVLDVTPIESKRGAIIGAHGQKLVTDRPVISYGIDRSQVPAKKAGDSARRLARLVGVDVAPYLKQVEAAGDKAFVEAITFRLPDVPAAVTSGYESIPGAIAVAGKRPLAPSKEFAAPILGSVGPVTAEMIKKDPEKYAIGDQAGLSGLQARYDDQLQGTDGAVVNAVSGNDNERELFRVAAERGAPLRITLDKRLQTIAEADLADVGPASALVAIRPSTGAIVAAANGPGNDGYNIATYGQAAPGSTFKSVSSLALLRGGLTPASVVPCTSSIVVDGKRFENYDDYPSSGIGQIPLRTAVANSCNTAFVSQASKVRDGDLGAAAASLGLGIDHDLGFPAYFGSVEPPTSQTEAAADMIGQGKVLASPMAMATVIASIQSGGTVVPRLVDSVDVSVPKNAKPLSKSEAADLRSMLRGVVTSGSGVGLADVPGPPVIAKTGTAEFERDGKVLTHAWMIAAQGDLAVAVFVGVGQSGSGTAGPILESFLRAAR